jgi:hypothetical protein
VSLLQVLERATSGESAELVDDAIQQLLLAESDDPRVAESMQLLLMSGAIQRILDAHGKSKEHDLASAYEALLSTVTTWRATPASSCSRPDVRRDLAKFNLREAWYRDFYRTRSDRAHGRTVAARKSFWTIHEHLLMASFVVPRLLLVKVAALGCHTLTEAERSELRAIDRLLSLGNLFSKTGAAGAEHWAWRDAFAVLMTETRADGTEHDVMRPAHVHP